MLARGRNTAVLSKKQMSEEDIKLNYITLVILNDGKSIYKGEGFQHGSSNPKGGGHGSGRSKQPSDDPIETPIVDKTGCRVKIINKTISVYDANGKLLRQEDIRY